MRRTVSSALLAAAIALVLASHLSRGDGQRDPRAGWCAFYGSGNCTGDPSVPALSPPAATG
jgi:hypothetical protein